MIQFLVLFLVFFPLVFGTISFFISKKNPKLREILSISINAIEMIAIIVLACVFSKYDNTSVQESW